jgi:hypothetical protein
MVEAWRRYGAGQGAEQLNAPRLGIPGTIVIIDTFRSGAYEALSDTSPLKGDYL